MKKQQQVQRERLPQLRSKPSSYNYLQTRPFAEPSSDTVVSVNQQTSVDLQPQVDRANSLSHSFGKLAIEPPRDVTVQRKLTIGQPGDRYEQEADAVAAQVVQKVNTPITQSFSNVKPLQRHPGLEEDEIQMKPITQVQRFPEMTDLETQEMEESEKQKKPLFKSKIRFRPKSDLNSTTFIDEVQKKASHFSKTIPEILVKIKAIEKEEAQIAPNSRSIRYLLHNIEVLAEKWLEKHEKDKNVELVVKMKELRKKVYNKQRELSAYEQGSDYFSGLAEKEPEEWYKEMSAIDKEREKKDAGSYQPTSYSFSASYIGKNSRNNW